MKKRIIALILLLCLLAACVPTPDHDAVKQKNTVQMVETVKEADAQQSDEPVVPAKEQMPDRLSWDYYTEAQQAHIVADVPIAVLSDGSFPLLRVERRTISPAQNLALAKALLGADPVYRLIPQEATQSEIEAEIRSLTEMLSDPSTSNPAWAGYFQEEIDDLKDGWAERLEMLKEQYRSAGDTSTENAVWDGTISDGATVVAFAADHNAELCNHIGFTDGRAGAPYDWHADYCKAGESSAGWAYNLKERIDPTDYDTARPGVGITPREAIDAAQKLMEPYVETAVIDVFWDDDATDTYQPGKNLRHAYTVHLMPIYHGTAFGAFLDTWTDGETIGSGEDSYCYAWRREQISVTVNDEGILVFDWQAPLAVTEVVSENCPLLPFSEIEAIAKQQLNRLAAQPQYRNSTLTVRSCTLGLVRIAEPYQMERALLTPVWCLYGDWLQEGSDDLYLASGNVAWPILEINAIDGSIIDPQKGY